MFALVATIFGFSFLLALADFAKWSVNYVAILGAIFAILIIIDLYTDKNAKMLSTIKLGIRAFLYTAFFLFLLGLFPYFFFIKEAELGISIGWTLATWILFGVIFSLVSKNN